MQPRLLLDEQQVVAALNKWWIPSVVMLSLLLQLLLLLTGGARKWNRFFRFTAWMAYNWADYVATTALGSLAQASTTETAGAKKEVYALWAPFLLLHLGAPDNISAYAMADAELWMRHGLTMVFQIIVTIYVVAKSARGWTFVLLSVCLTVLGGIKYAERTYALKRASHADIVQSSLPIYRYMLAEADIQLDVKGMDLYQNDRHQPSHDGAAPTYYYIIDGDKKWLHNFRKAGDSSSIQAFADAANATAQLVTLQDILSSEDLKNQTPSIVLICLGFALFKLYKRRLCVLFMYEWRAPKTRQFFLENGVFTDSEKLLFVLDVELRFLFDTLYTKAAGTAFSKMGVIYRILTTCLLVLCAVFILGNIVEFSDQGIEQARAVSFCLIIAALVIEFYQLLRLLLSDWCRVWLAVTYIRVTENVRKTPAGGRSLHCLGGFWLASLVLRLMKISSNLGRQKYWNNRIGQYTLIGPSKLNAHSNFAAKMVACFHRNVLPEFEHSEQVVNELKLYAMDKLIAACREIGLGERVTDSMWFLRRFEQRHRSILRDTLAPGGYCDFEHIVVTWHVATCVAELMAESGIRSKQQELDAHASKLLSRYMMYLMVFKPELLPCHADIARELAVDTERELQNSELVWDVLHVSAVLRGPEANIERFPYNFRAGLKAGRLLQGLDSSERWGLIGSVWVYILMVAAAGNKPAEQLQQLTLGGELLTNLWVLLGHLGHGSQ